MIQSGFVTKTAQNFKKVVKPQKEPIRGGSDWVLAETGVLLRYEGVSLIFKLVRLHVIVGVQLFSI